MVINWYGEGSFKIQSGNVALLSDPFESSVGLTAPRFKADIVLKTGPFGPYVSEKESEGRNIIGPGEYEVKGVDITGLPAGKGAAYTVRTEDMKLGFLGELVEATLSPEAMEILRNVDVLFVPAGGEPQAAPEDMAKLVKKLEPKIVWPCFYKIPGLKRDAKDVKEFEKALGLKAEEQDKLTIKVKDITWEGTRLITLKV